MPRPPILISPAPKYSETEKSGSDDKWNDGNKWMDSDSRAPPLNQVCGDHKAKDIDAQPAVLPDEPRCENDRNSAKEED